MNTTENTLPAVTATALAGGFTRYEADGEVVTAKSRRTYTAASVYTRDGERAVWLHARFDLAVKGSSDARRAGWTKIGTVEIQAAS